MTQTTVTTDRDLKARHRGMWALGNYPAVAAQIVASLGPELVTAAGVRAGQRVLDVAAGSGNAAIPAASTGAEVTAADLTPELLHAGRQQAQAQGVTLTWEQADAEELPYADAAFDAVISCLGVMFAPHHARAANELIRVCRAGGTIALLSWTPEGFVGQMLATMKPYVVPPPPGVQPPPLWGNEDHVRALLGDDVVDLVAEKRMLPVTSFATPEQFREYFKAGYGPTVAAYRGLAEQPERAAALDEDLDALARRYQDPRGAMEWEYLLLTARRR